MQVNPAACVVQFNKPLNQITLRVTRQKFTVVKILSSTEASPTVLLIDNE